MIDNDTDDMTEGQFADYLAGWNDEPEWSSLPEAVIILNDTRSDKNKRKRRKQQKRK
jgi:hypothetical protein